MNYQKLDAAQPQKGNKTMTKFNHFAIKANEIARKGLEELTAAETKLAEAEITSKKYPQKTGGRIVDTEYLARSARAFADLVEAQKGLERVRRSMDDYSREINSVRDELRAALNDEYAVDPTQLDGNVLELLKSGIMRPDEYIRLLNDAKEKGNYTTMRLICKYADAAASEIEKRYGPENPEHYKAQELRAAALMSSADPTGDKLAQYDVILEAFQRSAMNSRMYTHHWGEMVNPILENF